MNPGKARRRLRNHTIIVASLLLVYVALAAAVLSAPDAGPTSGIALLLPMLPLIALGMPWSIPFLADPYLFDDAPHIVRHLLVVGPAVLNVIIHGVVHLVRNARSVGSDAR